MAEKNHLPDEGDRPTPLLTRIVELFLRGDVAILFVAIALMLGLAALLLTPREEEPQIVVPMADVFISAPGLSAEEVEQQVTRPMEKLLYQIDGVEYVYSMSHRGMAVVTVRFHVGEDRVESLVKLHDQIRMHIDEVPSIVKGWVIKPVEIDDVPIVTLTLNSERYSAHEEKPPGRLSLLNDELSLNPSRAPLLLSHLLSH